MSRLRLALFGVLLLSVFGMSVFLLLRMSPAPVAAVPPDPPVPPSLEHFEALLPGGQKVELVGLAMMETDPKLWWKPDGRELLPAPVPAAGQLGLSTVSGREMRRVVIHVDGVADYTAVMASMLGYHSSQQLPSGVTRVCYTGGLSVEPGATETTVQVGVATEPRSPLRVLNAQGQRMPPAADAPTDLVVKDILVTGVQQAVSLAQTELSYEIPVSWQAIDLQLVAIDKLGAKHYSVGGSYSIESPSNSLGMKSCSEIFPLPPTQLDRFEYQFRLYRHWVTFKNVSLSPRRHTTVKIRIDSETE